MLHKIMVCLEVNGILDLMKWGILICLGYHDKLSPTIELKQQRFIFSLFYRLEVDDQSAQKFSFR